LIAYENYVNLPTKVKNNNKIWTSELANVACLLAVFDFREIVHLYGKKNRLRNKKICATSKNNSFERKYIQMGIQVTET